MNRIDAYPIFENTCLNSVDYNTVDVSSCYDYSPFGMLMPGRNEQANDQYSYGFQGQLLDDEIKGKGNSVNYKYRMHDPRTGRFFAVDPLAAKYPHNSPYAFSENRVIDGVEIEGLEVLTIGKKVSATAIVSGSIEGGIAIDFRTGNVYAYGSTAVGLQSDVSISSVLSSTFYPSMPSVSYLEGYGCSANVSTAKWGPTISAGPVTSGGYIGFNISIGVGAGIMPVSVGGEISHTEFRPVTDGADKEFAINIMKEVWLETFEETLPLLSQHTNLYEKSIQQFNDMKVLKNAVDYQATDAGKALLQNQLDQVTLNYESTLSEMKGLEEKINPLIDRMSQLKESISKLEANE